MLSHCYICTKFRLQVAGLTYIVQVWSTIHPVQECATNVGASACRQKAAERGWRRSEHQDSKKEDQIK